MEIIHSQPDELHVRVMPSESTGKEDVADIGQKLVLLASFAKELKTQSHLIHFNYEGSNFLEVHKFLKDQYEQHTAQFDQLGEFVRTLDYWMPMCSCGLKDALGPCFKNVESYDGKSMLSVYLQNLEGFSNMLKMVEPAAANCQAYDVANYLGELLGEVWKASWMIKATIRSCG